MERTVKDLLAAWSITEVAPIALADATVTRGYLLAKNGIDKSSLVSPSECPVFEKYDDRIPSELLRKAYVADRLRTDEIMEMFEGRE